MIKPFRKYRATEDWFDFNENRMYSSNTTFNLFDVTEWSDLDNETEGFKDKHERIQVVLNNGERMLILRVSHKTFDDIMNVFLNDIRLLDTRSMGAKAEKKKDEFVAMLHYKGPLEYRFNQNKTHIACCAFPLGFNKTSYEEIERNCIYATHTPLN